MSRVVQLWRTTTVRLTAMFVLMFVLFSVLLLAVITWQSSIQIQRQQANEIERDAAQLQQLDRVRGIRAVVFAVDRLSRQPGPGIYYLGDPTGLMITGNVGELPVNVLQEPGIYSFDYERPGVVDGEAEGREGTAVVRSLVLDSGLLLVVGRDVAERRGFTAIIFQSFLFGVGGILLFSIAAGVITSLRVLRRIDAINSTSTKIMSGNLSERIAVTGSNDEFDALATSLNRMLDRIEQLMQGLKEVSDNIAHDLKTPLNRLRNKAEAALRESSGGESQREALESIIAESDKLIRTFNALLMIARAEAGTPSGAGVEIDVSAVAADVAELYAPVAEEAGIELATDIAPAVRLRANRELIGQALVNLVENALKYVGDVEGTEARRLHISIAVRRQQGRVLVEVNDNGPGIPVEQRQRVLERFVRLEQSRTEPGSGLGLSLVAAVARLYGGDFRIEDNAPGVRAVIELPEA